MKVFVDTSAFYALISETDTVHVHAHRTWQSLAYNAEFTLVTSIYVVVETLGIVQRRLGMSAVRDFMDEILPLVDVLPVTEKEHAAALALLLTVGRDGPSPVDCSSFILMERAGIRQAFAFDKHFEARGYTGNLQGRSIGEAHA
jgi:uncharacterized protein